MSAQELEFVLARSGCREPVEAELPETADVRKALAGMIGYFGPAGLDNEPDTMPRWFRANGTSSQAIFKRFHGQGIPRAIFHYTTTAALISIIQNNEIWLSDATFLNDRTEVDHGFECAATRLKAWISQESDADVAAMLIAALQALESKPRPPVYTACFSWEADDLGQWRGYGRGGTPVSIELKFDPLMFGYNEGSFAEVRYDAGDQKWIFDQVIAAYRSAYAQDLIDPRTVPRRGGPIPREEEIGFCAGQMYHDFFRYIVSCKSPVFQSEREVRFVYIAHDFSKPDGSWFPKHPAPMFRESCGRIIPYLSSRKLELEGLERNERIPPLPIETIWVGPTADQALIARGIRRLLDANGYVEAKVVQSATPYRG